MSFIVVVVAACCSNCFSNLRVWQTFADTPPLLATTSDYDASVFETTIRVAGGMLAAYELTGDEMYVHRTAELVDRLLPAYDTPTGLPHNIINLMTLEARNPSWARSVRAAALLLTTTSSFTHHVVACRHRRCPSLGLSSWSTSSSVL